MGLFGLAWLLTLMVWWRLRRAPPHVRNCAPGDDQRSRRRRCRRSNRRSRTNEAAAARHSLLQWAQARWAQDRHVAWISWQGALAVRRQWSSTRSTAACMRVSRGTGTAWRHGARLAPVLQHVSEKEAVSRGRALPPFVPAGHLVDHAGQDGPRLSAITRSTHFSASTARNRMAPNATMRSQASASSPRWRTPAA